MSVKPVSEIPTERAARQKSYRQMIREDIAYAVQNNILKFEFEGDYNFESLPNAAKQIADEIYIKNLWKRGLPYVSQRCSPYIRITSTKGTTRRHVFCEITPENLEKLIQKAMVLRDGDT